MFFFLILLNRDGTTDVTRTLHFGTPSQYERECFTRVFKGQVSLGTALFPEKVKVRRKKHYPYMQQYRKLINKCYREMFWILWREDIYGTLV